MNKHMKHMKKNRIFIGLLFYVFGFLIGNAQALEGKNKEMNKLIEKGITAYNSAEYEKAEKAFRKALGEDPLNAIASYNLGLTLTEESKNIEAARFFAKAGKEAQKKEVKDVSFFNEGNVWLQKKKYKKAIESYKNALRNNPDDEEARYNLAIALDKLKKQQKKNKNNKNKNKNKKKNDKKDNKKDKNKKKDNKKDKNDKKKDNKNKDDKKNQQKKGDNKKKDQQKDQKKNNKGDQKKDQPKEKDKNNKGANKNKKEENKNKQDQKKENKKPGKGDMKNKNGKPGEQKSKLNPQQVKQLLIGLKNKEKKTQKKIQAKILKGKGVKKKTDKDW